eukprot:1146831-Pelagomonas_calceolata.AAC.2
MCRGKNKESLHKPKGRVTKKRLPNLQASKDLIKGPSNLNRPGLPRKQPGSPDVRHSGLRVLHGGRTEMQQAYKSAPKGMHKQMGSRSG